MTEGITNKYDTGVPPTDTDGLTEGSVNKYLDTNIVYIAIEKLATAPGTPAEGRIYYDTNLIKVRLYKGAEWVNAAFCADEVSV